MKLKELQPPELTKAVALFYDGESAPKVSAKGELALAEEIIGIAREHGIPLCDNAPLVDLLMTLELGDEIPEALYLSVAYIVAFAYQLRGWSADERWETADAEKN